MPIERDNDEGAGEATKSVECDRGCGWRQTLEALKALPVTVRVQLFRRHEGLAYESTIPFHGVDRSRMV